ncbi:RNA polymerase sigma-70 factor, ECF subfamily [Propionibacterium sp. oral taxon 192 str. F0372]|uniref:RNA polymerase sigma factor n=1 Tax=Propionibacterium sp. oral taxon 192 TaxID=671222 RepID=UPI000352BC55|nr:sigma-70 family RNA polymerase sigma factor [Propionibacterium sp. oral taxon 192]EPH06261.1 RNA polymerase sigma-70 factor, ECF subfamily [Propionibacterium sp. oral taxon 192 str. F0372]
MTHEAQGEAVSIPRPRSHDAAHLSASSTAPHDKDRYLVLRAQDGDIDAFEQLVERYQGRLFRTSYMIVRNRHDSEDIVQETLIQAWRSLHLIKEPAAFRGWLMRICTNKATSMMRKRQRQATDPYDAESLETARAVAGKTSTSTADPVESSEVNAQLKALADLLASVKPELRIVWILREIDDLSYEEIAQTLNLTDSTVRGRLARARSLVMRQMKEWA